ncbi:MAG: hypothetical protein E7337_02945 [Clostridiales bacterium]|nr:hypothetical protein [Clostridiales bacterium]
MLYFRRFVWFIAKNLLWICALLGMLVCGFYMALNISNIYVILNDGLEKRVDVILTRQEAEELNKYFHADFLIADPALAGALDGSSAYVDYNIKDFEYELTIEKLWAWPWDVYANCTVVERVPEIKGSVISSRKSEVSEKIPDWQGGRYDITLVKVNGLWKIIGMQQTTVLVESSAEGDILPTEVLLP